MPSPKKDDRSRVWSFLIYPDSAPEDFKKLFSELALCGALSPLHDKDKNDDDTMKKAHYHCLLQFDGKKSQKQVQEISDRFSGVLPVKVLSLNGSTRYLTHMDDADKAQYNASDVYVFGGFDYERHTARTLKRDTDALRSDVIKYIINEDIVEYADLVENLLISGDVEFLDYVTDKSNYWLIQYIASRRGRAEISLRMAKVIQSASDERARCEKAEEISKARMQAVDLWQAGIHNTAPEWLAKYVFNVPDGFKIPDYVYLVSAELKKINKIKSK